LPALLRAAPLIAADDAATEDKASRGRTKSLLAEISFVVEQNGPDYVSGPFCCRCSV
jgi:hypothetical protein